MNDTTQVTDESAVLVPKAALKRWLDAFAEELAAWDIDPPIAHVKGCHDEIAAILALSPAPAAQSSLKPLSEAQIEKLRDSAFSINNPFCPDRQSMIKAVRAAERAHGIGAKGGE